MICRLTAGEHDPQVKALLSKLLLSSPCSLCIVDAQAPDQPVVYVNRLFETVTGYTWTDVIGRNCRFMQAPPGVARKPSFASAAIKRFAPCFCELLSSFPSLSLLPTSPCSLSHRAGPKMENSSPAKLWTFKLNHMKVRVTQRMMLVPSFLNMVGCFAGIIYDVVVVAAAAAVVVIG
jgi:PAS domain-containing protein